MKSPHFQHPFRHFSFNPSRVLSSYVPVLAFKEISGDKGLRHAVNFYWNVKKISVSMTGNTYTQYADEVWNHGLKTTDETKMTPPPKRAGWPISTEDQDVVIDRVFRLIAGQSGQFVQFRSKPFGTDHADLTPVVYLTDTDRFALPLAFNADYASHYSGGFLGDASKYGGATDARLTLPPSLEIVDPWHWLDDVNGPYYNPDGIALAFEYWTY